MQAEHEALREARQNAGEIDSDGEGPSNAAAAAPTGGDLTAASSYGIPAAPARMDRKDAAEWRRELATDEATLERFKKRMAGRR
jgi:hypothetical protein